MSATTWVVVYNGGFDSQVIDEEGRAIDPTSWDYARRSYVRDMLDDGRLVLIDPDTITNESAPAIRMAKDEAQRLNDAIDDEKAKNEKQAASSKTDKPKN